MTERHARARAGHRRARAPIGRLLALACAAVLLALAPRAGATVYTSFDFETPSYGGFGRRLADHQLLKVDGTWHLFYTELRTPVNANTGMKSERRRNLRMSGACLSWACLPI